MTRKLHNTLMAALASSSLLIVGLSVSSPLAPDMTPVISGNVFASIDAQTEATTDAVEQAVAEPIQQTRSVRHRRQSLAMPFFSFAPRS